MWYISAIRIWVWCIWFREQVKHKSISSMDLCCLTHFSFFMKDCWKCWSDIAQTILLDNSCMLLHSYWQKGLVGGIPAEIHSVTSTCYCMHHNCHTVFAPQQTFFSPACTCQPFLWTRRSFSDISWCSEEIRPHLTKLRCWPTTVIAGGCIPKTVGSSWLQEADYFIVTVLAHILA